MKGQRGLGFVVEFGEAFASQKRSEAHIHTSTTGGSTSVTIGYSTPGTTTVTSSVTRMHDFWIRTPDNRQVSVQLINQNIPLADGQRIAVIFASRLTEKAHVPVAIVNYDANQSWTFGRTPEILEELTGNLAIWGILGVLGLFYLWTQRIDWTSFWLIVGFIVFSAAFGDWRARKAERRISKHVKGLIDSLWVNTSMAPMTLPSLPR